MSTQLFYSNHIETLAENFVNRLDKAHGNPFIPPIIIIPNPHLKKWLQFRIAESNGISANFDFQILDKGLWELLSQLDDSGVSNPVLMQHLDLQLLILSVLQMKGDIISEMGQLAGYLYNNDETEKNDFIKRAWQLSERLAAYFFEYEYYREEIICKWNNEKPVTRNAGKAGSGTDSGNHLSINNEIKAAQRFLYKTIFGKNGLRHKIKENLFTLPQYAELVMNNMKDADLSRVYMFGISHISPFHTRLIYEFGKLADMYIYQINPCSEFWEDVTTVNEDRWERVRSITINKKGDDQILSDNDNENSLLKLWGKPGRETLKLLSLLEDKGSRELSFISSWLLPDAAETAGMLRVLQNQILHRTSIMEEPEGIKQDKTIQVISCPDIFREIESVYNSIISNLEHDPGLKMTDISIMVPDIDLYAPVIKSVFSTDPVRIKYSLIDSNAVVNSILGKAIITMLNTASGNFTRKEVFDLILNPCFLESISMDRNDAMVWLRWADKLNIFHGFGRDEENSIDSVYTWEHGLKRLRLGRIMEVPSLKGENGIFRNFKKLVPFSDIDTSDSDLISVFSQAIERLYFRLNRLRNSILSGKEWIMEIESLISDFLSIPKDNPEEALVLKNLTGDLKKLLLFDTIFSKEKWKGLSLEFIKGFIRNRLNNISSSRGNYLSTGVNISALVPKRQIPFRIVYICGMGEGNFPGSIDNSLIDIRNTGRKIGDITRPDSNRYLFLETLISVRDKLYITYVSRDLQRDRTYYLNSVVCQLITYIEKNIIYKEFQTIQVPIHRASSMYFSIDRNTAEWSDFIIRSDNGKLSIVNYSKEDRLAGLLNLKNREKISFNSKTGNEINRLINQLLPDFSLDAESPLETGDKNKEIIALHELRYFLINPIELVLRRHLRLYDEDEVDKSLEEVEPFFSAYPFDFRMIIDVLDYYIKNQGQSNPDKYIEEYYKNSQFAGNTPAGTFADIDFDKYRDSINERIGVVKKGLSALLDNSRELVFYRNIAVGEIDLEFEPDRRFPCLRFEQNTEEKRIEIELNGALQYLWKDETADKCETLVLTNSSQFRKEKLIDPFMFYIAARSGYDSGLKEFIGEGEFIIHVSHKKGLTTHSLYIEPDEAKTYLYDLVEDFLDKESFDMLPFAVIANTRELQEPINIDEDLDDEEKKSYTANLIRRIEEDAEKMNPEYRPMRILEIVNPEVPDNAYDKVRRRLKLFFSAIKNISDSGN